MITLEQANGLKVGDSVSIKGKEFVVVEIGDKAQKKILMWLADVTNKDNETYVTQEQLKHLEILEASKTPEQPTPEVAPKAKKSK